MDSQPTLLDPLDTVSSSLVATPGSTEASQEVRTCWICQQDDVDDEVENTVWKSPCPCSLVAHDQCLLDWIADMETPKKGEIARNMTILCPQCKALLDVRRPHDYVVQIYDKIYNLVGDLAIPTAMSGLAGCFYSGFLVYGLNTMHTVLGHEEANRILGHVWTSEPMTTRWVNLVKESVRWSLTTFDPFFPDYRSSWNWRIFVGLPLIGPALIISRTRFADQAFALLLPVYFLDPSNRNITWPLTPGLAFSTLPYIRSFYNEVYRHTITPHEKRWDAAVQRKPREGETEEEVAAEAQQQDDGNPIFEIQIGAPDDFEEVEAEEEVAGAEDALPLAFQAAIEAAEAQRADLNAPPAPAINNPPAQNGIRNWEIRQDFSPSVILNLAMGALFFPTVAAYMGDILKHTLPTHWVGRGLGLRYAGRSPGLLKEKWGRTIVGGCLFVVLKDVVTLYCKWKKARDFGKRKIMDYAGKRGGN